MKIFLVHVDLKIKFFLAVLLIHLPIKGNVLNNLAQPVYDGQPDFSLLTVKMQLSEGGFLKETFLKKVREKFGVNVFIETGTYYGKTTREASALYDEVYSVELSSHLYNDCVNALASQPNVHLYNGESPEFLKNILSTIKGTPLFWLDAHYSSGVTAHGKKETPVVEEVEAIQKSGIKNGVVMIDDMRYFCTTYKSYPSLTEICNLVLKINPDYQLILLGDVLIAFPKTIEISVSPLVWALMVSRLYDEDPTLPVDIMKVDSIIAQAMGSELEALQWLHDYLSAVEPHGLCNGSFNWWYGLSLLYREHYAAGFEKLLIALKTSSKRERFEKILGFGKKYLYTTDSLCQKELDAV